MKNEDFTNLSVHIEVKKNLKRIADNNDRSMGKQIAHWIKEDDKKEKNHYE